jgi:hypothetical protein
MKMAPFNKLALVNLREKGNAKLRDRDIVNTRLQKRQRMERKKKYRSELRLFWDSRRDSKDDNHNSFWDVNNVTNPNDEPWWRKEIELKLKECGRNIN